MTGDENVEINVTKSENENPSQVNIINQSKDMSVEIETEITLKKSETFENQEVSDEIVIKDDVESQIVTEAKDEVKQLLPLNEQDDVFQLIQDSSIADIQQLNDENESEVTSDLPDLSSSFVFSALSNEIESPNKSEMEIVNENDKEKLLNLYQDLNVQKKSSINRNRALTNALSEFLQSKEPNSFQDAHAHTVDIVSLQKYNDALDRLYKINHRREIILEAEKVESKMLLNEKKEVMAIATERRDNLTEKLYNTGITLLSSQTGMPLSDKFVSKLIARFLKTQSDLSEARLDFIIIQNFLTEMKARDAELNNLGDGLSVIDYETMLSEVQCLQLVIESKNEDLDRLRQQCFIDTHKIKHLGEKYSQLLWTVEQQKIILNSRKMEEQNMRKILSEIKRVKDDLRTKQNDLIQQAGLLNKTPLLKDYDNVMYQVSLFTY